MGIVSVIIAAIGVVLALLGNLCFFVWGYSKLTNKVDTLVTQQIADASLREKIRQECNTKHDHHYAHEANTGIHQEALSEKVTNVMFGNTADQIRTLTALIKQHTADDMEVLRDIRTEIQNLANKIKV